jgi:DNA-binding IclR family transcriptional regulator
VASVLLDILDVLIEHPQATAPQIARQSLHDRVYIYKWMKRLERRQFVRKAGKQERDTGGREADLWELHPRVVGE